MISIVAGQDNDEHTCYRCEHMTKGRALAVAV